MGKIKKLTKKHRLPRWMRILLGIKPERDWRERLANIDEMHTVRTPCMYACCPHCGAGVLIYGTEIKKTLPDGYTIAQTIIDENLRAEFEERGNENVEK